MMVMVLVCYIFMVSRQVVLMFGLLLVSIWFLCYRWIQGFSWLFLLLIIENKCLCQLVFLVISGMLSILWIRWMKICVFSLLMEVKWWCSCLVVIWVLWVICCMVMVVKLLCSVRCMVVCIIFFCCVLCCKQCIKFCCYLVLVECNKKLDMCLIIWQDCYSGCVFNI